MKKLFTHIALMFSLSPAFCQGWVTKDVQIVLKDSSHIVVNGITGDYTNKGTGLITTNNTATIHVDGDWVNQGSTPAIGNNDGTVELTGGNQRITGTTTTSFNNLVFSGGGIKRLMIRTLVGGGYASPRKGVLALNNRHLLLNSNALIVNNNSTGAITRGAGLLIGDTDPTKGYSKVQWNLRDATAGNTFTIPFGTIDFQHIPMDIAVGYVGTQSGDSGYVSVATYPTNPIITPNNRPLPIGVPHLDNRYKIENDVKSVDRFYVLASDGYSSYPVVKLGLSYVDREWDATAGSLNTLIEKDIKPARYNSASGSWDYGIPGTNDVAKNKTVTGSVNTISGAWVLANYPHCPVSNFTFNNDCDKLPVLFTDSSYIQVGTIDTSVWIYEGNALYSQNTLLRQFGGDGYFDVKRKVRGQRGCWDSITKTIQIYPLPNSSFTYRDTCSSETTQFASNSSSTIGMPLKHDWNIDGNLFSTLAPIHAFGVSGIKPIQLVTENTFGCVDTLNQTIEIQPLPEVDFGFANICERQEAFFYDSTTTTGNIDEWRWRVKGKIVSYLQDHNQVFNSAGSYPVQLAVRNGFGCVDSVNQNITIWPKAKAKFDQFPKEIYITDPFVNFIESGSDANWWQWSFGDFSPEEFGPEALHQYLDTGIFRARLIANNDFKCADTFYRTIIVKPNLNIFIPNAFSPGPDNDVNTTFGPGGMLYGIKSLDMTIYTRWGEQIYHSDHIDKPWDGTYMGELVQEGTYLYLIKIKDVYNDVFRFSGTLSVIR
ncbi:MAG: gliding motility-associated-like protein [bacterium]|jgi:gliding motility-associated-like protein